jgi:glutamate-1-semialdehyde aminotransferase
MDSVIYQRAQKVIAQGALTNSKHPSTDVFGLFPTHFERGYGAHIYDQAGAKYLDLVCGLGVNLFGYGNDDIEGRVVTRAFNGGALGGSTVQEVITAEKLLEIIPWCDKVKWLNSGTEGCMAAVRMARTYTGRPFVLSEGYHGWSDEFVSLTPPANGINTQASISDLSQWIFKEDFDGILDATAAIIVEPVINNDDRERIEYLKNLRKICSHKKIILIFDEVVTGIRYPKFSVAAFTGIHPDLMVMGKAIGNGHKVGVVAGRREIMDAPYFVSGSYFSHIPSLTAVEAVLDCIIRKPSKYNVSRLNEVSKTFIEDFNKIFLGYVKLEGWGNRATLTGPWENIAIVRQELIKCHIFTKTTFFFNWHIASEFDSILDLCRIIRDKIDSSAVRLEGQMPQKPLSLVTREKVKHG